LITRQRTRGLEVFIIGGNGDVLPIFSFEEEANMFLQLGVPGDRWQVRETTRGELASVLHASCRDIGHVALDPLPETVGEGMVELVSLGREHFIRVLLSEFTPPSVETVGVAS
jgi:hypothetical protein